MRYLPGEQLFQDTKINDAKSSFSAYKHYSIRYRLLSQNINVVILLRQLFDSSNHITTVYHNKRQMTYLTT